MAIYTKKGDNGTTSLANGERVSKTDSRLEAYGTVDELNSWIGLLRSKPTHSLMVKGMEIDAQLQWIQNKLFNLGASLSEAQGKWIVEADVVNLELWIDQMQRQLPQPRAFILPAGGKRVCRCQVCRTICRRAERRMLEIVADNPNGPKLVEELKYINRLSDYLFVLARFIGFSLGESEQIWQK